jgi:hypothetical protein
VAETATAAATVTARTGSAGPGTAPVGTTSRWVPNEPTVSVAQSSPAVCG